MSVKKKPIGLRSRAETVASLLVLLVVLGGGGGYFAWHVATAESRIIEAQNAVFTRMRRAETPAGCVELARTFAEIRLERHLESSAGRKVALMSASREAERTYYGAGCPRDWLMRVMHAQDSNL